jgi:hypothetical protein
MKRSDGESPHERGGPITDSSAQARDGKTTARTPGAEKKGGGEDSPTREPRLEAMIEAFARGDYARVRADAKELERASHDDALKQAARALVDRTNPDPLALALLAMAALLLAVLGGWWMVDVRPPDGPHRPPPPHSSRFESDGRAGRSAWAYQLPGSFDPGIPLISRRACFHARCTTQDIER